MHGLWEVWGNNYTLLTMERTWRWFGKQDKITLAMLKEIGVEGIVL